MQITHQEARRWIQIDSDGGLRASEKAVLEAHLILCADCRKYAHSMKRMEIVLRPLLKRQWNQQPTPLSITLLQSRSQTRGSDSMILATRIAAISVMFLAFLFSAWQLSASSSNVSAPALASGPAFPPVAFTSTQRITATTGSCTETIYVVQENDTLAHIAFRFAADEAEIARRNGLRSETVSTGMTLIIPVCDSTPTGTMNAIRSTYMPATHQITSTPIGY